MCMAIPLPIAIKDDIEEKKILRKTPPMPNLRKARVDSKERGSEMCIPQALSRERALGGWIPEVDFWF